MFIKIEVGGRVIWTWIMHALGLGGEIRRELLGKRWMGQILNYTLHIANSGREN